MKNHLNDPSNASHEKKRDLLVHILRSRTRDSLQPLVPVERKQDQVIPLSFPQERMWFLDQLIPGNLHNIPAVFHLLGPLQVSLLERGLNEIVDRHEILRTLFREREAQPVQIIIPTMHLPLRRVDVRNIAFTQRSATLTQITSEETQSPFDLVRGPLIRALLIELAQEEFIFVLTIHHSIFDGWSMSVLFNELCDLYAAYLEGLPSPLAPLPLQYADYTLWQRSLLQNGALQKQLQYWKRQLADAPMMLKLPTDFSRPSVQVFRGRRTVIMIPEQLTDALKALCLQENVTLFMLLLAAFQLLLARYSGQEDILVGTPIANRTHTELRKLIGCFINTLVLRLTISGDPTFQELLAQVREIALGAYAHQDLPFEKLVEELQPVRDLSRHPFFQIMFVLQNTPKADFELKNIQAEYLRFETGITGFDVCVFVLDLQHELRVNVDYNTDLFKEETIQRFAQHYHRLLQEIVSHPHVPLSQLTLLSSEERQLLLVQWNATQRPFPQKSCVHQLFEQQVQRSPDASALLVGELTLTYDVLNEQANRLAHFLLKQGVRAEEPVAICMQRSEWLIVALLAVLKAGGTYVPLDPSYPAQRLRQMLQQARIRVILRSLGEADWLDREDGYKILRIENPQVGFQQEPTYNLELELTAQSLAYIIFTSGSTGQPKGVSVEHRSIARLVKDCNYASISANDVFLSLAPTAFDASTFEIWGSLLNGARLVLLQETKLSLEEIVDACQIQQVTILWLTAGLFHRMAQGPLRKLNSLRQLLAGGDVLSPVHVSQVVRTLEECQVINGYGPTENTTFTCCYTIPSQRDHTSSIPIGHPISNTQVYVLNHHLMPVPIGIPGELYIGGEGLARGYVDQPAQTAQHFISNPFSLEPGARMYKTGDLVRYLSDGALEFLGRIDHQTKVRGFRVELEEIATVLLLHPRVQDGVVLAHKDSLGEKRLVAYIVLRRHCTASADELNEYLKHTLPDYMLPSCYLFLDTLPLNANGKVERKALPAPDWKQDRQAGMYVAPRTLLEEILAGIWTEVLEIERVGIFDNFFALGGHSLLATVVISHIHDILQLDLPLRTIFEAPTIAEFANVLVKRHADSENGTTSPEVRQLLMEINERSPDDIDWFLNTTDVE